MANRLSPAATTLAGQRRISEKSPASGSLLRYEPVLPRRRKYALPAGYRDRFRKAPGSNRILDLANPARQYRWHSNRRSAKRPRAAAETLQTPHRRSASPLPANLPPLSDDAAFAKFLRLRADALLNDDYYARDRK